MKREDAIVLGGIGLGLVGAAGALYLSSRKAKAALPPPGPVAPPPPPPGLANLYGQITDSVTHQPIGGVLVTIGVRQNATNSGGNYAFIDIEPDSYTIEFNKEGYGRWQTSIILLAGNNELSTTLTPLQANLFGRVTNAAGQPITGAAVLLAYVPETLEVSTDSSGYYRFTNIYLILEAWSLTVMAKGYKTAIKSGFSVAVGNNEINIILEAIAVIEASQLLLDYQAVLVDAIRIAASTSPDRWVNIPGYGLQYASNAIPQLKSLMIAEAISIGLISLPGEAYFDGAIMYHISGDTLAPYWWPCPYGDGLKFRSPTKLQAHIDVAHWEISNTLGTITYLGYDTVTVEDTTMATNMKVTWRNDSPFSIRGHVRLNLSLTNGASYELPATVNQDALVTPGFSITVYFPWNDEAQFIREMRADLYALPSQKFLDSKSR